MSAAATQLSSNETADIARRAARSGVIMFIARGVRFFFIVVVNFILINLLLPADFGMVRYVMLVVGIANLINEMGLTTAIVQKEHLKNESLWSLFLISTFWGFLLYGGIFLGAPIIARFFATPELTGLLRVGALMIPATGVTAVHRAYLRRKMAYKELALIEMGAVLVSSIASVSMAAGGFGVWALVTGTILFETVISGVLLLLYPVKPQPLQSLARLKGLLFFGVIIVVSRIIDYTLGATPFFLIGKIIGKKELGLFSVAFDIANFPRMAVLAALLHVMLSMFSRLQSDRKRLAATFSRVMLTVSLATMPLLLVMIVMPEYLLRVISLFKYEGEWMGAAPLLKWLAAMGIIYVFTVFPNSVWIAVGKVKENISVSLAMLVTAAAAVVIGVQWGIEGICIAMLIRALVIFFPYVYIHYRLTGIPVKVYLGALVPSLVAGVGMAGVLLSGKYFFAGEGFTRQVVVLVGGAVTGVGVYAAILWLFFRSTLAGMREIVYSLIPRKTS